MIAIIDYEAGNLRSVERAFIHLGLDCRITAEEKEIRAADRVVFPGVGAAGSAMRILREGGLDRVIRDIAAQGTPFLGICLGAQILLDQSEEDGGTDCLGLIPGSVRRFDCAGRGLKIPHMGWNSLMPRGGHPVLGDVDPGDQFYFVHAYYLDPRSDDDCIAWTDYGGPFVSVMGRGSILAVQFHPEKSGPAGLRMLKRFAGWRGDVGAC